jgi:hypothetical protein
MNITLYFFRIKEPLENLAVREKMFLDENLFKQFPPLTDTFKT